jgi:predicted dehydrogenase
MVHFRTAPFVVAGESRSQLTFAMSASNKGMTGPKVSRRQFVLSATGVALTSTGLAQNGMAPDQNDAVELGPLQASTEQKETTPGPFLPDGKRVGFAIVGLGHLSLDQILPAFGHSQFCRPVALVSGSPDKAHRIAAQYGIRDSAIYSYGRFEELAHNSEVRVIYIVLPNGMHEEYVVRGAKTGKHILCEKPMATSSQEASRMIAACAAARVKLMIAYRQQYEPSNCMLQQMVREGKLGKLRGFLSSNSQREGEPSQWRLHRKLSGGGCLSDVGLYCINAARFLSGEEPIEALASLWRPNDDPRFREVEAAVSFTLRFPSGFTATCTTGYDVHKSQFYRLEGTEAWASMEPAYGYHGNRLKWSQLMGEHEIETAPQIEEEDQFALEMDHFAECVLEDKLPHTPGEEGRQDHRFIEAIYEAARTGRAVKINKS